MSMTIIEDLQSTIEAGLTAVRTRFDDINSLNEADKQNSLKNCERQSAKLKNALNQFKFNISTKLSRDKEKEYKEKYIEYNEKLSKLEKEIKLKKIELSNETELLFGHHGDLNPDYDLSEMEMQDVIASGDIYQDKSKEAATRILKRTGETKEQANEIAKEAHEVTERLLRIEDDIDEMDSAVTRINRKLRSFGRALATDKVMLCCIVLAVALIVAVVIYYIITDDAESDDSSDQV